MNPKVVNFHLPSAGHFSVAVDSRDVLRVVGGLTQDVVGGERMHPVEDFGRFGRIATE